MEAISPQPLCMIAQSMLLRCVHDAAKSWKRITGSYALSYTRAHTCNFQMLLQIYNACEAFLYYLQ